MGLGFNTQNRPVLVQVGAEELNLLTPYAARMFSHRWMIGSGLNYSNSRNIKAIRFGFSPFGRFYFVKRIKRSLYFEANTNINFQVERILGDKNSFGTSRRAGGFGIGMNRWILPTIALDFYLGGEWSESKFQLNSEFIFRQTSVFRIGLEAFF